ncbi:MAG: hypothetical protein ACFCUT_03850 [Kiloniellaceae bacterium]
MTTQIELEKAVTQPWSVYKTPEAVLVDTRLNDAEKRRVLESWERDARELAVAEEENMGGGEPDMLGRVLEALATLPAGDERPRGPATKHGAQPTPSSAPQSSGGPVLTGTEARQGEIILKTPARRGVFIGGLVLAAVACVFFFYLAWP